MTYYRKRPVVIEAVEFTGANVSEVEEFVRTDSFVERDELFIVTLEGNMHVSAGDFVIRGVQGEYYPCKPDIFDQTYEEVPR